MGKTSLASRLRQSAGAILFDSTTLSSAAAQARADHRTQERRIEQLDKSTRGKWLSLEVNKLLMNNRSIRLLVVDAIGSEQQVRWIRQSGWPIVHVHLTAARDVLKRRYSAHFRRREAAPRFDAVADTPAQRAAAALEQTADVVINTDRCSKNDVFARVAARLEIRPVTAPALVDVLIGGQYGSEGKGNIVHYLAPEYDVLVRVGGPNAGHKVFRRGQDPFTFHQLPSGALGNQRAKLVVGAGAVLGLDVLRKEISELAIEVGKLIIDPQAMVIEGKDIRLETRTLKNTIASTAQGVGAATARKSLHRYPNSGVRLARDIPALKHYIGDTVEFFASCLSSGQRIMLEGTQGTSLSIHHGPYPHVTSRVTTAPGCLAEAGIAARHVRRVVLVCRTYPIRVGNTDTGMTSGFMSLPISLAQISKRSGIPLAELRKTERTSTTNRPRRIAEFDWAQLRRSLLLNGPTDIALTFADYLGISNREAFRYEQLNVETLRFIEEVEKVGSIPVSLISTAFSDRNIIDRRMW